MNASALNFRKTTSLTRGVAWGLGLSLVLHVALLVLPGLHLPGTESLPSLGNLEAQLAVSEPKPAAQPHPAAQKTSAATQNAAPRSNASAAASTEVEAASNLPQPPTTVPVQAAASNSLPQSGRLRFNVIRGDQNFVVGESIHEWKVDGKHYSLKSTAQTVGIAAVFRPVKVTQSSEGEIGAEGLQPHNFRNEKGGNVDTASFDWAARRLTQRSGTQEQALTEGAQDLLSMFYQFSLIPLEAKQVAVWVATGKKLERYVFEVVGEEKISLNLGEMRTLHLRTQMSGSDNTEIWLALDYARLPVKIRYVDKKGDIYDQIAEDIDIQKTKPQGTP